jgi:hypothetical protein
MAIKMSSIRIIALLSSYLGITRYCTVQNVKCTWWVCVGIKTDQETWAIRHVVSKSNSIKQHFKMTWAIIRRRATRDAQIAPISHLTKFLRRWSCAKKWNQLPLSGGSHKGFSSLANTEISALASDISLWTRE